MTAAWADGPYGTLRFFAAGFTGHVYWETGGYRGAFCGWKLKQRFPGQAEAKSAVEVLARRKATELLAALDEKGATDGKEND